MVGVYASDPKRAALVAALKRSVGAAPQATMFRWDGSALSPVNYAGHPKQTSLVQADLAVVGGELSSLCTAVDAAERGYKVALVYAGPLGGLSADAGGNLRYFDSETPSSHPLGQRLLWRKGLGIDSWVAIPPHTDALLQAFLATYAGRIVLVKTASYDGLWASLAGPSLGLVTTQEGVAIKAKWYVDADPESRLAEKAGVPYSLDTPHMSDGLSFDVLGMSPADLARMNDESRLSPAALERFAGLVGAPDGLLELRAALERAISKNFLVDGRDHAYGLSALAAGFDFVMRCRGLVHPDDAPLAWLNSRRKVSGFNVAKFGDDYTFNSLSYRFVKALLQGSHSISTDPTFAPIREVEAPALQAYLRFVAGDDALVVRLPEEFYVRSSSAFFKLLHPYVAAELDARPDGPYYTTYPMDLRDIFPRDALDWPTIVGYLLQAKGKHFWSARASAAETAVPNLFLVNKCGVTPAYSGGMRTEQSAINLGAAVVAALPAPSGP